MSAVASAIPVQSPTADRAGFESMVRHHWRELHRYAYRLCGNVHVAEDLVQETLTRAWRSLDRLQDPGAMKGWLYTIVRRENARRFERQRPQESEMPTEEIASRQPSYDTSTEAFVLRRAIRDLPPEYREPLILQVLHGYSQQEIADRLGISAAGAGTRLFRARAKLRAALGERA